ncbi:L,D-transpeptidase [Luedemannella helvata]|uniref:L,D-transpeptidase n=1 Tax=Luedemannella helvata TaxID=349315 RepID=UPI0031D593A0
MGTVRPFLDGPARGRRWLAGTALLLATAAVITASSPGPPRPGPRPPLSAAVPAAPGVVVPPARPAPRNLPVISYEPAPRGFPPDPAPLSTRPLTEGLHPLRRIAVYDAPGGRPRAFLKPDILGVPLTVPVVERRAGWTAVLLPSVNRRIGWLPPRHAAWATVALRDQIIIVRRGHRMTWLRDGVPVHTWRVTLGMDHTPTPLGRTFILGRSRLPGMVYGDTDVFALGAVPDKPHLVPAGLRGAHIGIHTWFHDGELGRNTTDGCIRLTRWGQRKMLATVPPGTPVVVLDHAPAGPPRRDARAQERPGTPGQGRLTPSRSPSTASAGNAGPDAVGAGAN